MSTIDVRVLGPLEVALDGRSVPLGGPQRRAVLAALLVEDGRVVSTDELTEAIWPRELPSDPVGVLHTHIHALRRALEPGRQRGAPFEILVSGGTGNRAGYALRVTPDQLDEARFAQLVDEGRRALANDDPNVAARSLREARQLRRGPPLAEIADWPFAVRYAAKLDAMWLAAEETRMEAELALGRHAHVLGELADLVDSHPSHEGFRLQLALALYRSRRREEAAGVCREGLERLYEQGLDSAALQYLQQAILRQAPELIWKPPPSRARPSKSGAAPVAANHHLLQLPRDIGDFTGRDGSVADLLELLQGEPMPEKTAVVTVAIAGKAGVGKTALAVHLAHRLLSRFPDGALFVDLRGTERQPVDPSKVLITFLVALGIARTEIPEDLDERASLYRSQLAHRRMLIVLDNAAGEAQVQHLLPGSSGCAAILTSRRRLAGLHAVHSVMDVLEPDQAVEFLGKVAGPERVAAEPTTAQAIVGLCGYLPLAVRIAGARLAMRPDWRLQRLVERLVDERGRLSELEVGDLEVRASFELSYQGQPEFDRRAFRLLALLDAPDFAAWVPSALLDIQLAEAERAVDRLVAAHLLDTVGEDESGQLRYRFHDLLKAFARERAQAEDAPEDRGAALQRVLSAYVALGERAAGLLEPGDVPIIDEQDVPPWSPNDPGVLARIVQDEQRWFAAERTNIVTMTAQAYDNGLLELAWLLPNAIAQFFDNGSHFVDWERTHQLALDAAHTGRNRLAEAATLRNLGKLSHFSGNPDEALTRLNQCLSIFRAIGHRRGEAYSLRNLGVVHEEQGRFPEAIDHLKMSRSIFDELHHELGAALSLRSLGDAYRGVGRHDHAVACFDECLPMFRNLGNRLGEGSALIGLGIVYGQQDRLDDAVACFDQCLPILKQLGHNRLQAYSLGHLADIYERQHRFTEAISQLDHCLPILDELRDLRRQATMLDRRAILLRRIGDHRGARAGWQEALTIYQRLGAPEAVEVQAKIEESPPPGAAA